MSNLDNNTLSSKNNENISFDDLKKQHDNIQNKVYEISREKRILEKELREITKKLQKNCKHSFIKEVTTTGCYREYNYICSICGLWN